VGLWYLAAAWGGESELAVERGWLEMDREAYGRARAVALGVITRDPTHAGARELYVEASAAAGWGASGALELAGEAAPPPWAAVAASLQTHVAAGDKAGLKADVAALRTSYPDEPDLLAPLWSVDVGPAVGLRARWATGSDPREWSEEAALRWVRLARDVDQPGLNAAAATRAREFGVPERPLLDRPALRDLGQAWSESPPMAPFVYPSELPVAAGHLDEIWTKAARWAELEAFWTWVAGTTTDGVAHERIAALRLPAKRPEDAAVAIDQAMGRTGGPRESDQVALGTGQARADFVRVLRTRAAVAFTRGDVVLARGDLGTAYLLAESQVDPALAERIDQLVLPIEQQLEPKYRAARATASQVALGRIGPKADDPAAADEVLTVARDARLLAFAGTATGSAVASDPDAWVDVVGDTWFFEGRAHFAAGRYDQARAALALATLLLPDDPQVWEARARAHEKLGERDAGFAALAVARGRGAPGLDERLAAAYAGPGDWKVVATTLGGEPPAVVAPPRVRGVPGPARGGPGRGSGPKLGQPFPAVSFDGGSTAGLQGRVVVVSAYQADCEECLQILPAYARLALRLRLSAVDMVLVPVNTDEDEEAFRKTAVFARNWGQLVHDPELASTLGIRRYPTTWIVDRSGVTRFFVDHWLSAAELEQLVRQTP
jgi:hypothetical protein